MKILNIVASMDPSQGGVCQGVKNNIAAMQPLGISNEVVSFDISGSPYLKEEPYMIHALGPAIGPYSYCARLHSWLLENFQRFDIVIIHGLWLHNSFGSYWAWRKLKKKNQSVPRIFVMAHGMLDPYFQVAKGRRFKAIRNWFFWNIIEEKVVNGVDGVLFTCEEELLLARKTFKVYHPKSELNVGYGIQRPPASKSEYGEAFFRLCPQVQGRPFLLFLSRINIKKGVDLLVKAYNRLSIQFDLPDLVIAGPGLESEYGKRIKKMASTSTIHFPGMLQGDAKWGAFYNCEAFVLPSHQENFGIAVVEALACKKPVLITDRVNIWREIEKANAAIVVPDTEEGIYNMLFQWVSTPPEKRILLNQMAFQAFSDNFDIENSVKRMVSSLAVCA
ncbi:glycosyl transferase [Salinimicrobium marinum]|uniref:Glycosyl transferase n=1 Tax=Salinimicrobium marinum TaxID=680283 RepID=A0A918W1V9_9FLAO|nr:glycosyltransferase [Salinimicrobium marinum]GHA48833.1 glycosyl transferase [Salinimicrobium marinum]